MIRERVVYLISRMRVWGKIVKNDFHKLILFIIARNFFILSGVAVGHLTAVVMSPKIDLTSAVICCRS
jgi:hypothetical protein